MRADYSQDAVVACTDQRVFVEAPAGYGKTTTMVRKLVADLVGKAVPHPKRVLALTFSVNAARKMRNDVQAALSATLLPDQSLKKVCERIDVYNYHALSRRMLSLYAKPLLGFAEDINDCLPLNENRVLDFFHDKSARLTQQEHSTLNHFDSAVKSCDFDSIENLLDAYCDVVVGRLIPSGCVTYNGILALTLKLLRENPQLSAMYGNLYAYVIVDEAQDTNVLSYQLLKLVLSEDARLFMFGDSLQRIYGFIGAIPDFVVMASRDFNLKRMELAINHRFAPGSPMQLLDRNIRENIRNPLDPSITTPAIVPMFFLTSAEIEVSRSCAIVEAILKQQPNARIAILLHTRGYYGNELPRAMEKAGINCFNALFEDDDPEYIDFNEICLSLLEKKSDHQGRISLSRLEEFVEAASVMAESKRFSFGDSYKLLLAALSKQVRAELLSSDPEAKYEFVYHIFENRTLRHTLNYISSKVTLSTMHSAKGLEWDYVIIPEMMQWVTPSFVTCKDCVNRRLNDTSEQVKCNLAGNTMPMSYIDEQCVFYVAVTRARRKVIFLATTDRVNSSYEHKRGLISCLLLQPGVSIVPVKEIEDLVL